MRALQRKVDWNRFPNVVVGLGGSKSVPPFLEKCLNQSTFAKVCQPKLTGIGNYRLLTLPIKDAQQRTVAKAILLLNFSSEIAIERKIVILVSIIAVIGCLLLLFIFYFLVGKLSQRLINDETKLVNFAARDGLTKLCNHRTFYQLLESEIARAKRYQHALSLLMIDIDHFKKVNDEYGHIQGDFVLSEMSRVISEQTRAADFVCRYGGEEIMVILPNTIQSEAIELAERIRRSIECHDFNASPELTIYITVSIGVSLLTDSCQTTNQLVASADSNLYKAKKSGRNRTCY